MAIKTKVGVGECFVCKREVVWRKTEGGALSCFCQHCDIQAYAKDGTEAERMILKAIGAAPVLPTPAVKPSPVPAPVPAPKKSGAFGVFGL